MISPLLIQPGPPKAESGKRKKGPLIIEALVRDNLRPRTENWKLKTIPSYNRVADSFRERRMQ